MTEGEKTESDRRSGERRAKVGAGRPAGDERRKAERRDTSERGERATIDTGTGEVHGSGSGAGGKGNPNEDYDQDSAGGSGGISPIGADDPSGEA
jgi:hypothetical protein